MPESQNTEWKSRWKDEYLEWICGYANAQGGKIYIGCDDEGNIVGLPNARKMCIRDRSNTSTSPTNLPSSSSGTDHSRMERMEMASSRSR